MADPRGRRGRPYRTLQAQVFSEETHCWICGEWVDQALPCRHPKARSLDHIIPLDQGGPLLARGNAHLAHYGCNSARGNGLHSTQNTKPIRTELTW